MFVRLCGPALWLLQAGSRTGLAVRAFRRSFRERGISAARATSIITRRAVPTIATQAAAPEPKRGGARVCLSDSGPISVGSREVVYIDTEGKFRPERLRQFAESKGVSPEAGAPRSACVVGGPRGRGSGGPLLDVDRWRLSNARAAPESRLPVRRERDRMNRGHFRGCSCYERVRQRCFSLPDNGLPGVTGGHPGTFG